MIGPLSSSLPLSEIRAVSSQGGIVERSPKRDAFTLRSLQPLQAYEISLRLSRFCKPTQSIFLLEGVAISFGYLVASLQFSIRCPPQQFSLQKLDLGQQKKDKDVN